MVTVERCKDEAAVYSTGTVVCGCHGSLCGEREKECVLQYWGTEGLQVDLQVNIHLQLLWLNSNTLSQAAWLLTGGV